MSEIQLSAGIRVRSENIERAEYYPHDALRGYGDQLQGERDRPYLFIKMKDGAERITGEKAEKDTALLEQAGIKVVRHPPELHDPPM